MQFWVGIGIWWCIVAVTEVYGRSGPKHGSTMAEPTGHLSMQKYVYNMNFWPKLISEMKSTCNFGLVKVLKIYFSCRPGPIGAGPGLLAEASK